MMDLCENKAMIEGTYACKLNSIPASLLEDEIFSNFTMNREGGEK